MNSFICMTSFYCLYDVSKFLYIFLCLLVKNIKNLNFRKEGRKEGRMELFYLTTHSTHFIYGYMASDIW